MTPPRLAPGLTRLVRLLASRDAADAAIGDIYDEFAERIRMNRGPRWPHGWIHVQAAKLAWSLATACLGRLGRAAATITRDAARALRRSPGHSLFVVFILTAGIASGTITFSVVNAVVLRPLALDHSERLVRVPTRDAIRARITPEGFWVLHDRAASFENVAAVSMGIGERTTIDGVTRDVSIVRASSDVFSLLGFRPAIGRLWNADEDPRRAEVAVIGYRFWQRLGGDPDVVGRQITLNRSSFTVIGILDANTDVPGLAYSDAAIWIPDTPQRTTSEADSHFGVIGRMRPGVTTSVAAAEIQHLLATPDWRPDVQTFLEDSVARVRGWMLLALAAVGLVLLIACVNAANVMLSRTFRRSHELAVRSSLGSSRRRLAVTLMAEGLLLALAAGVCSLVLAMWGVAAARSAVTAFVPWTFRASSIALDGQVFGAAILAAVVTGALTSVVPAWQASRGDVMDLLKGASPNHISGRSWRNGLLAGEIASVSILLVVSWMFVASFVRVTRIDLGVDTNRLLAVASNSSFNGSAYDMAARLRSVPGVNDVALVGSSSLPLIGWAYGGAWDTMTLQPAGDAVGPSVRATRYRVTPNFFRVAGVRFQKGSSWSLQTASAAPPVVLDERAAAMLFGADNPLGRRVRVAKPAGIFTVVGVVPHVYVSGPERPHDPEAYFDLPQGTGYRSLFFRTSRPADEMVPVVTAALAPFAPDTEAPFVRRTEDAVAALTAVRRFNTVVMFLFGAVGMLIGATGIYGVMAATVAQQTREIGIRVALGATPKAIHGRVLRLATRHVTVGLSLGLPLGWYFSRGFASYLFQVTPADASVYAGVAALLAAVGISAALVPARRAAKTDPIQTLRAS